ncbi:SRPBCC family protein [Pseudonocardia sp. N23]|uniref:SRPBCC family protein n=1 Tax=Pseudonocardia sp. N23 TaxID=1987376 RepID=UPI000BFD3D76|nr:SRPBCC family protein [Pseudonocardia sp. N23]
MVVELTVPTTPGQVFAVLADGWSYPLWVVGATHMRDVDDGWPAVGTRLHHSVGVWPLQAHDTTEVVDVRPGEMLELRARLWPTGSARIVLALHADSAGTRVEMDEFADSGPATLVPRVVQDMVIAPRNRESLARLAAIATRRGGR